MSQTAMPPALGVLYQQHPDILSAELNEGETVLLSLPAARYYQLNETGSLIWFALGNGATLAHLASALQAEYAVEAAQALAHTQTFLDELAREGLIKQQEHA